MIDNRHFTSIVILKNILQQANIKIYKIGSIAIESIPENNSISLPAGEYTIVNVDVIIPVEN